MCRRCLQAKHTAWLLCKLGLHDERMLLEAMDQVLGRFLDELF